MNRLGPALATLLILPGTVLADSISTLVPMVVHETSAFLSASYGNVSADGMVTIEYGPTTAYGFSVGPFVYPATYHGGVSAMAYDLVPGTTYHVRARFAVDGTTTAYGEDVMFQTTPAGGTLFDSAAETLAGAPGVGAMFTRSSNGTVCGVPAVAAPHFAATRYRPYPFTNLARIPTCVTVRYLSNCATLGSASFDGTYAGGDPSTGLLGAGPGAVRGEYQFNVAPGAAFSVVMVDEGTCGAFSLQVDSSALGPPLSVTGAASARPRRARLAGTASAGSAPDTTYAFDWGSTDAYGNQTAAMSLEADAVSHAVNADITGLEPGGTYHYRLVVTGPGGTSAGDDASVTTPRVGATMTLRQPLIAIDRRGTGTLELDCPDVAPACHGTASVTVGSARARRRKPIATIAIDGAGTLDVALTLTRKGRSLVRQKKNVKAALTVSAVDEDDEPVGLTTPCRLVLSDLPGSP